MTKEYSGKYDKKSGVRVKHIYSDNHNLEKTVKFKDIKVGSINYKMHFKSCENNSEAVNVLRPENLTLEAYSAREPYEVFHSGRINVQYDAFVQYVKDKADLLEYSLPYTFTVLIQSQYNAVIPVEKELDFDSTQFGEGDSLRVLFKRDDDKFFPGTLYKDDYRWMEDDPEYSIVKFNRAFDSSEIYYFDEERGDWYIAATDIGDGYAMYSSYRISRARNGFQWDTSLRYSTDVYGYNQIRVIEIVDKSNYDLYGLKLDNERDSEFWENTLTYSSNLGFVTNITDVTYVGLGKSPVSFIVGVKLNVSSINDDEYNDSDLNTTTIDIIDRVEIFPNNDLSSGITINKSYYRYDVKLYIPFATDSESSIQYLDDNCNIMNYRLFYLDFNNMFVGVIKNYSDRLEYLTDHNFEIVNYTTENYKETN